jgi:signal transduction histidine kinase/HD-like signal output (HDOD) protein
VSSSADSIDRYLSGLTTIHEIPSLPEAVRIAVNKTLSLEKSANQIASIVRKDPSLTLKLLKLANSSFYSRGKRVDTVQEAIIRLGYRTVKSIILSISMKDIFSAEDSSLLEYRRFWLHSVATGVIAELIEKKLDIRNRTDTYTTGLLHDVGKVLLMISDSKYPRVVEMIKSERLSFSEAEQRVYGFDHTDASTFLFRHWNLPETLVEPVREHHGEPEAESNPAVTRMIVKLANQIAHLNGYTIHPSEPPCQVSDDLVGKLGLSRDELDSIEAGLKKNLEPLAEALNIPRSDIKGYFEVLSSANRELGDMFLASQRSMEELARKELLCRAMGDLSLSFLRADQHQTAVSDALRIFCSVFPVENASIEVYLDRERSELFSAFSPEFGSVTGEAPGQGRDIEIRSRLVQRDRPETEANREGVEYSLPVSSGNQEFGVVRYRSPGPVDQSETSVFMDHLALGLRSLQLHQAARTQANRMEVMLKQLKQEKSRAQRLQKTNQLVLESSPVGVVTIDSERSILHWNSAAERLLAEPLTGKRLDELQTFAHFDFKKLFNKEAANTSESDLTVQHNGKRTYLHVEAAPIEGTSHTLVLISEMTQRLEREKIIIQKEKMATLGELAAGIAHNLRSPLAVVKGIPELILSELDRGKIKVIRINGGKKELDTDVRDHMELINRSMEKTFAIIDSIMAFSRQENGEFEDIPLASIIEEVRLLTEHKTHGKSITFDNLSGDCVVHGNRNMLIQIFINLMNNSLEAIEGKGTIEVKCWSEEDRMVIHFTDTGRGVDPEHLEKIFEPFFTTSGKANGTGIGLSVTRRMVTLHGGSIKAVHRPEGGTIMEIVFPVRTENNEQSADY